MELNKTAFQKDQTEILTISAEEANPDSVGADISAIDNGYSNMSRAFFKAAFANKENLYSNSEEYSAEEKKDREQQMWSELVEQMLDRVREEVAAKIIEFESYINEISERRARYGAQNAEYNQLYLAKGNERDRLEEEQEEALEERETVQVEKQEAEAQTELATSEQERCSVEANLNSCAATYAPEAKNLNSSDLYSLVQERTALILEQSVANQLYVTQKLNDVDTQLTGINQQLEKINKDMQDLREKTQENEEKIRQLDLQREKLEENLRQAKEFEARMADPEFKKKVENGDISQENLQAMMPDFMKKDAAAPQMVAATPAAPAASTASISYLSDIRESRPTSSAAASMNDGGGIKASSMQSSFAMAASGAKPQEAAPVSPAPVYEQNRQMAMTVGMS